MPQITEFSVSLIGGIILAGCMITFGIILIGIGVYNLVTKKKITKEIFDEKERSNGQHKGGARGKF